MHGKQPTPQPAVGQPARYSLRSPEKSEDGQGLHRPQSIAADTARAAEAKSLNEPR